MAYDTNPRANPGYIPALRTQLEKRFSGQRDTLDPKMLDVYLQTHRIEGKAPDSPNTTFRPVGAGLGGLKIDLDVSVLDGLLRIYVIPRGGQEAENHASDVLEPFLEGVRQVTQEDIEYEEAVRQDLRIYGRTFLLGPIPSPMFWTDDEMRRLVEAGDQKKIAEYKAENLPIVCRHWDASSTLVKLNDKGEPSEAIHVGKMPAGDIRERWGVLPRKGTAFGLGRGDYKDDEDVEVIEYVNGKYIDTVIVSDKEAEVVQQFEHRMNTVPVVMFQAGRLPKNGKGWVWKGALFHLREGLQAIDDVLTDMRTQSREHATAPTAVFLDPVLRSTYAWPDNVDVKHGATPNFMNTEKVMRYPAPEMTETPFRFFAIMKGLVDMAGVRRDALTGEGPSGQSAADTNLKNTIAKGELKAAHKGLERGWVRWCHLALRCPIALNEEFPGIPDKVTVRVEDKKRKSREIAVTRKDVEGWSRQVRVHLDLNLPVNEGQNVVNYNLATSGDRPALSPQSARERFLNHENPQEEDNLIAQHEMFVAATKMAQSILLARAAGAMEKVGGVTDKEMMQRSGAVPAFAQKALDMSYTANGEQSPLADLMRGQANTARTGRPQRVSNLGSMGVQ